MPQTFSPATKGKKSVCYIGGVANPREKNYDIIPNFFDIEDLTDNLVIRHSSKLLSQNICLKKNWIWSSCSLSLLCISRKTNFTTLSLSLSRRRNKHHTQTRHFNSIRNEFRATTEWFKPDHDYHYYIYNDDYNFFGSTGHASHLAVCNPRSFQRNWPIRNHSDLDED